MVCLANATFHRQTTQVQKKTKKAGLLSSIKLKFISYSHTNTNNKIQVTYKKENTSLIMRLKSFIHSFIQLHCNCITLILLFTSFQLLRRLESQSVSQLTSFMLIHHSQFQHQPKQSFHFTHTHRSFIISLYFTNNAFISNSLFFNDETNPLIQL